MKNSLIAFLTFLLSLTAINSYAGSLVMSIPTINPFSILVNQKSDVTISAEVIAPDNNLKEVSVKIKKGSKWVKLGNLQDNGKDGDLSAKDGTYSRRFKFLPKNLKSILLKIVAIDKNKKSTEGNINLKVISSKLDAKPEKIVQISGNNQTGNPGKILKEPFVVAVENELGKPAPNVPINILIAKGEGKIITASGAIGNRNRSELYKSDNIATIYTDAKGRARFRVKLGNSDKDLKIDVTSPSIPGESVSFFAIVGSVDTPDLPTDLAISGNYVFIADRFSGLQIVDVSNPLKPKIVNTLSEALGRNLSAQSVSVNNNICYLVNFDPDKLLVIDVSNPENIDFKKDSDGDGIPDAVLRYIDLPVEASDLPIKILIENNYLFILYQNKVKETGKVLIIDMSDLTIPTFNAFIIDIADIPSDLKIKDNFLYIASGGLGIALVDIQDPSSPVVLNTFGSSVFSSIFISDNYLYYIDYENKLHVVDVSAPKSPVEITSIPTTEGMYADIAISGNFVYLASQEIGIQVFDVSDKKKINLVGKIDTPSIAQRIKISGNFAYILDEAFGLYVASIPGTDAKDSDGDGVIDFFDAFPQDPTETLDTDKDGIGNNADDDDDNDGFTDIEEISAGTNSLNPKDFPVNLPNADSKIIFVDSKALPRGNGLDNKPYSSITEALLAVKSARASGIQIDEINVKSGIYSTDKEFFPLTLPSDIVLKGSDSTNTVIDAENSSWVILIKNEKNVTVEGVTLRNGTAGIVANHSDSLTIKNNVIEKNEFGGVLIGINSFNNIIENNIIKNNKSRGISIFENSSADTIKNNIISENKDFGIFIATNSTAKDISWNTIMRNSNDGVQVYGSSLANAITNNTISENTDEGITIGKSSVAENISENNITKNGMDGIQVSYNSSANIKNNSIRKNKYDGIFITGNSTATIGGLYGRKLKITFNGYNGIEIDKDSTATINLENIYFKGNKDKEIEGKYESK